VKSQILAEGLTPFDHATNGHVQIALCGEIGTRRSELLQRFSGLPGVATVTPINRPFKLVSREFHPEDTVIRVLDAVIGDGSLTMMAGPCSVESREQLLETADAVKAARDHPARRSVQAAHQSLCLPGARGRGSPLPGGSARSHRAPGDHRS